MSRYGSQACWAFWVATELFFFWPYVTTEILCRDRFWDSARVFWVATEFSPWVGFPCRDIAFYVATVGHCVMSRPGRGREDGVPGASATRPSARLDDLGRMTERLGLATERM